MRRGFQLENQNIRWSDGSPNLGDISERRVTYLYFKQLVDLLLFYIKSIYFYFSILNPYISILKPSKILKCLKAGRDNISPHAAIYSSFFELSLSYLLANHTCRNFYLSLSLKCLLSGRMEHSPRSTYQQAHAHSVH